MVWIGSLLLFLSPVTFADDAMDWADQEAALGVQRLLLPVRINTMPAGESVVLIDEADRVLVRAADFERWATGLTAEVSPLVGDSWVVLDSLSPLLTYRIDLADLVLDVTIQATQFGSRSISLLTGPPPDLRFLRDLSSFFNYSVAVRDGEEYYGAVELGTTIGPGLLLGNVSIDSNGIRRNLAQYVVDWPFRRQRLIAGDYLIAGDAFTGGGLFTGLRFGRDFELDPYFFRYPAPDFQAVVETPSTIEIYSNGRLVRREQVEPGVIDLRNLQTSAGQGVADIVIVDAFGRRTDL
ncbi:MAG: fimbria/pilus outer membrane usher protein, partial [Acidobacteria bacterium]|nr:fimbria/pilus outer membrane usher protein [Acidobacteriota bacterium]